MDRRNFLKLGSLFTFAALVRPVYFDYGANSYKETPIQYYTDPDTGEISVYLKATEDIPQFSMVVYEKNARLATTQTMNLLTKVAIAKVPVYKDEYGWFTYRPGKFLTIATRYVC